MGVGWRGGSGALLTEGASESESEGGSGSGGEGEREAGRSSAGDDGIVGGVESGLRASESSESGSLSWSGSGEGVGSEPGEVGTPSESVSGDSSRGGGQDRVDEVVVVGG